MHIAVSAEARKRANREFRAIVLRIPSFVPPPSSRRPPRVSHLPPSPISHRHLVVPLVSISISPLIQPEYISSPPTHIHTPPHPPLPLCMSLFQPSSSLIYIYTYISPGVLPLFFVSTRQTTIIRRDQLFSRISPYNNYKKASRLPLSGSGFNSIRVSNVFLRLRFRRIFFFPLLLRFLAFPFFI